MFSLQTLISNCCIGHDEIKTKDKDQSHFKETRFHLVLFGFQNFFSIITLIRNQIEAETQIKSISQQNRPRGTY